MCYLIAKERNAHGCIALKTTHGQHLADFKYALDDARRQRNSACHHQPTYSLR